MCGCARERGTPWNHYVPFARRSHRQKLFQVLPESRGSDKATDCALARGNQSKSSITQCKITRRDQNINKNKSSPHAMSPFVQTSFVSHRSYNGSRPFPRRRGEARLLLVSSK